MKILRTMLALLCLSGGVVALYAQTNVYQGSKKPLGLNNAELKMVRERLPCLYPGMIMREVFHALGVDLSKRAFMEWGSGPSDDYRVVYQLAPASNEHGYNLVIVHDQERKFKRADIACWKRSNKCAEDNEKSKNNPSTCPRESQN